MLPICQNLAIIGVYRFDYAHLLHAASAGLAPSIRSTGGAKQHVQVKAHDDQESEQRQVQRAIIDTRFQRRRVAVRRQCRDSWHHVANKQNYWCSPRKFHLGLND
jgi:hypothetical protein